MIVGLCCLNTCFHSTLIRSSSIEPDFILANTGSKSEIFQSIFLGKRGLVFIIISRISEHMKLIASSLFQAKPEAGKLIVATIALLVASTSIVMLVSPFCTLPMLCLSHVSFPCLGMVLAQ